ncbi:MAG: flavodoxin family protein [Candidatus Limnocylindrales bacterium]
MTIRVLGVSGSPRLGATHRLVNAALLGARQVTGTTTSYVSLAERRINPCNGCGPCMRQGSCVIDDDMQELYGELLAADAVILGTPVYYGAPTALCKAFMERVQGFGSGEKKLRLKVGGGIATGQGRNGGQETALQAINIWFHINDMLPVGITSPSGQWGVTAQSGFDPDDLATDTIPLKKVSRSMRSLDAAWLYGRKIATVASIVQAGKEASGLDLPDRPYGQNLPEAFPEEIGRAG